MESSEYGGLSEWRRAARLGEEDALARMIGAGFDIEADCGSSQTALWLAARFGRLAAIELLIARGARVESRDGSETTPLGVAAEFGHAECARALLAAGADLEARDADGLTPALRAGFAMRSLALRVLMDAGASLDARCGAWSFDGLMGWPEGVEMVRSEREAQELSTMLGPDAKGMARHARL